MSENLDELIQKYSNGQKVQSKFLKEQYEDRQKYKNRMIIDPRDPNGRRLSIYWEKGDTVFTVTIKKVSNFFNLVLNPDTYTYKKLSQEYQRIKQYDIYIVIGAFMVMIPIFFYAPFFIPRMKKIKQEYIIQSYFKKRFFEQQLQLDKQKPMSLREMKKILDKMQS